MISELEKLKKQLEEIQQKIEEVENREQDKSWEPKGGCYYISVDSSVHHRQWLTEETLRNGVAFATREAAYKAAKVYRRYHRLYRLAEELNDGWVPDWTTHNQVKFVIKRDHADDKVIVIPRRRVDNTCGIYFKTEETALKAVEIIEAGGLDR